MLMGKVDEYLTLRRSAGFELGVPEYHLRNFARFCSTRGETLIRTPTAIEWAGQAPSSNQREHRLQVVARFARHLQAEDPCHEVPPKGVFRHRRRRPPPYIFMQHEVSRLLSAASRLGPPGSLRPQVYRTLFALLYATGMRISEALGLRLGDLMPDGLIIRKTKFKKSRLVPLHETAVAGLGGYLQQRTRVKTTDDHLFLSLLNTELRRCSVQWTFRRLLKEIALDPGRGGRRPRIHDIRHSFAARALEACPEGRDNVGRHMLALSTYMGHAHIADTYWYLEATPLLMQDVARACEALLKGGAR